MLGHFAKGVTMPQNKNTHTLTSTHHNHNDHNSLHHTHEKDSRSNQKHSNHEGHNGHDKHAGHSPEMFRDRFWLSLLLTLPIIYFSEQFQTWFNYEAINFTGSAWINPVLGSTLFFYGGLVFIKGAIHELRAKSPGMMTLISLAISVAYIYSLVISLGLIEGKPFYWELATLIVIMLLGHWFEMRSVQQASNALDHLALLIPHEAHQLVGNAIKDIPVSELQVKDRILVRPGEQIPADGFVVEGSSSLNEAFLTGESKPVTKSVGDEVVAGAVNSDGALTIEVSRIGDDTTLSQIQRLVAEAQGARSQFQNFADRAAKWLTYIAITGGLVTFVVWIIISGNVPFAITRAVTVLIIACPHALGLAIPLVIVNATALSAKNGILVRNREAFERAKDIGIVAFDKTGTLTEGAFGVRQIYSLIPEYEALRLAAGLEQRSEHPLAKAIMETAKEKNISPPTVTEFDVVAGKGVSAEIEDDSYRMGRPEWVEELGLNFASELNQGLDEAEARGESVIVLMDNEKVLALFVLADKVRQSAKETIKGLQSIGVEPVMITGDAEAVAKAVAEDLGLARYYARVLPEGKSEKIKELKSVAKVAFVGDGINDAPALLEAELGVAIGAGTNVAIESADLVLVEDDPKDVLAALKLSKATYSKMLQNLFWATGYNSFALPLAAGVLAGIGFYLSPAVGALLMSLSTIVVAINAMLLRRIKLT